MAAPFFQAAGTPQAAAAADVTVPWPAHQAGDIGLLIMELANQAIQNAGDLTTAGWTQLPDSPQSTGTAGAASATRLIVYWKRAASSSEPDVNVVADIRNHINAQIVTFRGCVPSGNPHDVTSGGVDATSDTSLDATGDTTTVNDCLVVVIVATDTDIGTARWSSWANADLTDVVERVDQSTTQGNGGGIAVTTGVKAVAGAFGNTTATAATATVKAFITVALLPDPAFDNDTSAVSGRVQQRSRPQPRRARAQSSEEIAIAAATPDDTPESVFAARRRELRRRPPPRPRQLAAEGVEIPYLLLDDFNRTHGSDPSDAQHPWTAFGVGTPSIDNGTLAFSASADMFWGTVFGANQEVYCTYLTGFASQLLLYLKTQGDGSHIEVYWDQAATDVVVERYNGSGTYVELGRFDATFSPGDEFRASCSAQGVVKAFKNGVLIGWCDATSFPSYAATGQIGLGWDGSSIRVDNFGGGSSVVPDEPADSITTAPRRDLRRPRILRLARARNVESFDVNPPSLDDPIEGSTHAGRRAELRGKASPRLSRANSTDEVWPAAEDPLAGTSHAARRLEQRGKNAARLLRATTGDETEPPISDAFLDTSHAARRVELRGLRVDRLLRASSTDEPGPPEADVTGEVPHAARRRDFRGGTTRALRASSSEDPWPPLHDALTDTSHAARRLELRGRAAARLLRATTGDETDPPESDSFPDTSHAARRLELRGLRASRVLRASSTDEPGPPQADVAGEPPHAARRRDLRNAAARVLRASASDDPTVAPDDVVADPPHAARRRELRGAAARALRASSSDDLSGAPDDVLADTSHAARRAELRGQRAARVLRASSIDETGPPEADVAGDAPARRRDLRRPAARVQRAMSGEEFVSPSEDVPTEPPYASRRRELRDRARPRPRVLGVDEAQLREDAPPDGSNAARRRELRGRAARRPRVVAADGVVSSPDTLGDMVNASRRRDLRTAPRRARVRVYDDVLFTPPPPAQVLDLVAGRRRRAPDRSRSPRAVSWDYLEFAPVPGTPIRSVTAVVYMGARTVVELRERAAAADVGACHEVELDHGTPVDLGSTLHQ